MSTPDSRPRPSVAGLALMGALVSAAAVVMLPAPGRYVLMAVSVVLLGLGALDAARRRRQRD